MGQVVLYSHVTLKEIDEDVFVVTDYHRLSPCVSSSTDRRHLRSARVLPYSQCDLIRPSRLDALNQTHFLQIYLSLKTFVLWDGGGDCGAFFECYFQTLSFHYRTVELWVMLMINADHNRMHYDLCFRYQQDLSPKKMAMTQKGRN